MSSQGISIEKSPSFSNASESEPSRNPFVALIQKLKMKFVNVNLFQTIEGNLVVVYEIKALLKQLHNPDSPDSIVDFILEFEPFVEQIA